MSLRNRFLVSIVFGLFSYPLLFLIRGYELTSITWYAFLEYGGCVSVIVYLIIESHRIKSKILSSKADWIFSTKKKALRRNRSYNPVHSAVCDFNNELSV
ncbi:MAG TPA: hypothetical protein DF712_23735 [Balneola sp.]|nr:hypothetical protein [Balneola sp.]